MTESTVTPTVTKALRAPQRLFLYGKPKVGKTTAVSTLPRHLIIDTEVKGNNGDQLLGGTAYCEGATSIVVDGLGRLRDALEYLKTNRDNYDYVIIDTIDHLETWVSDSLCQSHGVTYIGDIPHGKGWSSMRTKVLDIIDQFARASKHIIIIGHQKDGHSEDEIEVEKINLTGKLKTHLCSVMDGVGRITRDEDNLMIDFRTGQNTDAGCRLPNLAGQYMKLDWATIYPE